MPFRDSQKRLPETFKRTDSTYIHQQRDRQTDLLIGTFVGLKTETDCAKMNMIVRKEDITLGMYSWWMGGWLVVGWWMVVGWLVVGWRGGGDNTSRSIHDQLLTQ